MPLGVPEPTHRRTLLDQVERLGNSLPEPATLFVIGAILVMAVSQIGEWQGWSVQPVTPHQVIDPATGAKSIELAESGEPLRSVGLLSSDGLYWSVSSMVNNFVTFKPLGVILVGMLGVGIAERSGLIGALLKALMLAVPARLLTPTVVFLGVNSSLTTDAGYIVLPPLAALLYKATGRSPLVGIAAVFAGIGGGFSANLLVTALDPLLSGITTTGARTIDPTFQVNPACNWWFMIAATFLLTGFGWWVTAKFVEPRFAGKSPDDGGPVPASDGERDAQRLTGVEVRALWLGCAALGVVVALMLAAILVPGGPLQGLEHPADPKSPQRWAQVIVPLIFFAFAVPGVTYGAVVGTVRNERDAVRLMVESMVAMAPVIVLCFFAAQFISYFEHSNLGRMLAMAGGKALAAADLPRDVLIVVFVLVTAAFNLLMASASAKWFVFAPIFVPMFMMVGISPALTQASYRVGDSVTNIITPLNAYLVIILAVVRRYAPRSGMGTLVSMMLPYTIVFTIAWIALLLVWVHLGVELGPGGELGYP